MEPQGQRQYNIAKGQAAGHIAEPIQTVMRKVGMDHPYERLKELTRGRRVTAEIMQEFVKGLDLPKADKARLMKLTPSTYIGIAEKLARIV